MSRKIIEKKEKATVTMNERSQISNEESSSSGARSDPFTSVNERPVDDISLEFFYKPHTISLLAFSIIGVMYFAFVR